MNLGRYVRQWLEHSFGNRLGAALVSLTLGFLLLAGAGNLVYLIYLTHNATQQSLDLTTAQATREVTRLFQAIQDDNRLLALNPTVVSGVLDVRGQETYLRPLLTSLSPTGRTPEKRCVVDFAGRPIGCANGGSMPELGQPWIKEAQASERPRARIVRSEAGQPRLYLIFPVVFVGSDTVEGAVIASYDLASLIHEGMQSLAQFTHIHLRAAGDDVLFLGEKSDVVHAERKLTVTGGMTELDLALSLGVSDDIYWEPIKQLVPLYCLAAALLCLAAFVTAKALVPRLIGRLVDMTENANAVAAGLSNSFEVPAGGRDEVAHLAQAFATMTDRLQTANETLELHVRARTEALRKQENLVRSIINAVPGVIFQLRQTPAGERTFPFVSQSLHALFGVDPGVAKMSANPVWDRVLPADMLALEESIAHSAQTLAHWRYDFRIEQQDGRIAWLHGNAVPEREADGALLWHGILTDVTEHKLAELALAESESYAKALFAYSHVPLGILDPVTGRFIDCNSAAASAHGLAQREMLIGRTFWDVSSFTQYDDSSSVDAAKAQMHLAMERGFLAFEWRFSYPNGTYWDADVRLMSFSHRGRRLLQASLEDVSERRRTQAEIWRRANFDGLTGLANRGLCFDRLEQAIAQARRSAQSVGVLFLDLDGFKAINDRLGHAAGDELLKAVARRLEDCVREQDTVARLGGDEFVLVLQGLAGAEDVRRVAESVRMAIQNPFRLGDVDGHISASVGGAMFPEHAQDAASMIDLADQALYGSKRAGKNCFRFVEATV